MATYKVLQDIEAEDKLLGPLTLKQFIFAAVTIGIGFVEFKLLTLTSIGVLRWPFVIVLIVPFAVFGFLAAPISRDQSNDVWLLARLRFIIKPRTRIWNQDGISQLVTITVPKRLEQILTNGLSQTEVKSRLTALASTLDSRGWAVKNVDVNLFGQPGYLSANDASDRLVAPSNLPVSVSAVDVQASDDMLDTSSNPTAQHLDQMVQASTAAHKKQVINSVRQGTAGVAATPDYWFMNQPAAGQQAATPQGYATFQQSQVVAPGSDDGTTQTSATPTADEEAIIKKIESEKASEHAFNSHLKTIQPLGAQGQPAKSAQLSEPSILPPVAAISSTKPLPPASGTTSNPAILNLANNDDLNVATIARQAKRISEADDEVVISLH